MTVDISDSAAFYIRTALNRDLAHFKGLIESSQEVLSSKYAPAATKESAQENLDFFTTRYEGMVTELRKLPESLRPADLLDCEVP